MAAPSAASASSVTTPTTHTRERKPTDASTDQFAGATPQSYPPLGIAVFGAGIVASNAHLSALSALHTNGTHADMYSVSVKAVWSRKAAKAQALARKYGELGDAKCACEVYHGSAGIGQVLERPDIDAVVLAVPISELAQLSIRVRKAGKHVLSEKPVAHCVAAAREAILFSPKGPVYAVAENFRFEAGIVAAALDAARLNPVCISLVAAMHMPPDSLFATPWRLVPRHVGAQLLDGGVHFVAAMRMAAKADVVSVSAHTSTASMHLPPPDSCSAMLSFSNGVHATMAISYAASEFVWALRVIGTDGNLCLKRVTGAPAYELETHLTGNMNSVKKRFPFSGYEEEFRCFVRSCRTGVIDQRIEATAALNDLATIEAIIKSAECGKAVNVESLEVPAAVTNQEKNSKSNSHAAGSAASSAAGLKHR